MVQEGGLEDYKEGLGAEKRKIGSKRVKIIFEARRKRLEFG